MMTVSADTAGTGGKGINDFITVSFSFEFGGVDQVTLKVVI